MKLKTLQPRLKELDTSRGIKMVNQRITEPSGFRAKKDNGRTLTLTNAPWRRLRASVLASEPLCRHCTARGLTVPATDVDHRDNDPSNNELVNLMPLCQPCHSRKTHADMGHRVSMGCDAHGMPLDVSHPWNQTQKSPES